MPLGRKIQLLYHLCGDHILIVCFINNQAVDLPTHNAMDAKNIIVGSKNPRSPDLRKASCQNFWKADWFMDKAQSRDFAFIY